MKASETNIIVDLASGDVDRASITETRIDRSTRKLHKYVFGMVGISLLFGLTYANAMNTVAKSGRYGDGAAKSLTWRDKQKLNVP